MYLSTFFLYLFLVFIEALPPVHIQHLSVDRLLQHIPIPDKVYNKLVFSFYAVSPSMSQNIWPFFNMSITIGKQRAPKKMLYMLRCEYILIHHKII